MSTKRLTSISLVLTCILLLTGCATVKLYPLAGDHIVDIKRGQMFTAPRDGYFLSSEYLKEVLNAKVEKGF